MVFNETLSALRAAELLRHTSKAITDVTVEMGANDHTTSYYWDDDALVTKVAFPEGNGIRYV